MLIGLDIGNSSIKIGYFVRKDPFVQEIPTHPRLPAARYSELLRRFMRGENIDKMPEGIILSSVVPGRTEPLLGALRRLFSAEPLMVDHTSLTGIKLDIPNPEELGADRIANAVAAEAIYKCPVAVVDAGTATTISVVGKKANYIGGAILPGVRLMNESLAKGAARLTEARLSTPPAALGRNTDACIISGLLYGTAGAVEKIIGVIETETGLKLKIALTGGFSGLISNCMKRKHRTIPLLTLKGLRIIHARNSDA